MEPCARETGLGTARAAGAEAGDGAKYDASYYRTRCGQPYEWGNASWEQFFGAVADFIVSAFHPGTVLDAGCGVGFLVGALRDRGVDARGFDISSYAISQVPDGLRPYCVLGSVTDEIAGRFDLISCVEVLEHVDPADAARAIENLTAHTDRILFSSTPDDFNEPTHVNVRQPQEWIEDFAAHGFVPRPSVKTGILSPQAVVFERRDVPCEEVALLGEYENVRYQLAESLRREHDKAASELRDANSRAREATNRASEATNRAREATNRASEATNRASEAANRAASLERAAAEAEAARAELATELATVRGTTWWRIGRPVRGAITRLRLATGAGVRPQSTARPSYRRLITRLLKPFVPVRLRRALREEFPEVSRRLIADSPTAGHSVDEILDEALPLLRPLRVFPAPGVGRRLTLVTDSLNANSLFGGVGTSIILATLLAERLDASLRVATRNERPNPTNFNMVLRAHEVRYDRNVEFEFAPLNGTSSLATQADDLVLTTSWWSTWSALRALSPERIIYLLQEDERLFYPAGDEQVACSEILADGRIRFVVNTAMLQEHLVRDGFGNIGEHGIAFEPAFPKSIYYHEPVRERGAREFFFYARPANARNLFLRGLEAVNEAIASNVLEPEAWTFRFVGSRIPPLSLHGGIAPVVAEQLPWSEYAALLRRVDVGLSLMSTPHPSYPPLDLAACGAVAVTNRFGLKAHLDRYSANILCTDLSRDAIVEGIAAGVRLAEDEPRRMRNYETQRLSRSWPESLGLVLEAIAAGI